MISLTAENKLLIRKAFFKEGNNNETIYVMPNKHVRGFAYDLVFGATEKIFEGKISFKDRVHYCLGEKTIESLISFVRVETKEDADYYLSLYAESNETPPPHTLVAKVMRLYPELNADVTLPSEWFYRFTNNITECPKCKECGSDVTYFIGYSKGYGSYCGTKCQLKYINKQKPLAYVKNLSVGEVIEIILSVPKDLINTTNSKIASIYYNIEELTEDFPSETTLQERAYCVVNGLKYNDLFCTCTPNCSVKKNFFSYGRGYRTTFCNEKNDRAKPKKLKNIQYYYDRLSKKAKVTYESFDEKDKQNLEIIKTLYRFGKVSYCKMCGSPIPSNNSTYCSVGCMSKDTQLRDIITVKGIETKKACGTFHTFGLWKYQQAEGLTNISQTEQWKEMIPKVMTERYGVTNAFQMEHSIKNCRISTHKKTNNGVGYLYVLKFDDKIKIGITNDIQKRMRTLKRHFGHCELIYSVESEHYLRYEKLLHREFKDYNIKDMPDAGGKTEFFGIDENIAVQSLKQLIEQYEGIKEPIAVMPTQSTNYLLEDWL